MVYYPYVEQQQLETTMKDTNMTDLLENGTRDELLDYCAWNDANGIWTDEQCAAEGYEPATIEDLRAMIRHWINEA